MEEYLQLGFSFAVGAVASGLYAYVSFVNKKKENKKLEFDNLHFLSTVIIGGTAIAAMDMYGLSMEVVEMLLVSIGAGTGVKKAVAFAVVSKDTIEEKLDKKKLLPYSKKKK